MIKVKLAKTVVAMGVKWKRTRAQEIGGRQASTTQDEKPERSDYHIEDDLLHQMRPPTKTIKPDIELEVISSYLHIYTYLSISIYLPFYLSTPLPLRPNHDLTDLGFLVSNARQCRFG